MLKSEDPISPLLPFLTHFNLIPLIILLIHLSLVTLSVYRLYFHPLAKYPGPFWAKLSDVYLTLITVRGHRVQTVHGWHLQYGKIVRIGVNELSFCDGESIRDIYGQSATPCLKDPKFYRGINVSGGHTIFNVSDRYEHSRLRRLVSDGFALNTILKSDDMIREKVSTFLNIIRASQQPLDIYDYAHFYFVDVVSALALGKSFGTLSTAEEDQKPAKDLDTWVNIATWAGPMPWIIYLPTKFFREGRSAISKVETLSGKFIEEYRKEVDLDPKGKERTFLGRIMQEVYEDGTKLSNQELIENAILFFVGGSGTSASSMLYLFWEVGRHAEVYRKLTREIRASFPDTKCLPDCGSVVKLPYLSHVFDETMRIHGPVNGSPMPRISPGKVIGGHYIPPGVTVENLPYTTHRDPDVFQNPEEFDPERWENPTPQMKSHFRPFSTGPRNCIGVHQARVQILSFVAALYQQFDVAVNPQTTPGMMEFEDRGLQRPQGQKFFIHVTPLEGN